MAMISEQSVRNLSSRLRGRVVRPADKEYEVARRVANRAIDRRPALIVRCAGADDVLQAIEFARTNDLLVAVRGGGHIFAGKSICDGGIVIDLSNMKDVRVDPDRRIAVAEPGVTLGDFDQATQAYGLVTPLGTVPQTGIAGLTLGGGIGWVIGRYGLACDNLRSACVVTAEGRTIVASDHDNEDLLWGLRGGGGNFGVVVSFEYDLHPLTHVLAGTLTNPREGLASVLRFVRDYEADNSLDELTIYVGICPIGGQPMASVYVCHCGDVRSGERVLERLRAFGPPVEDTIRVMSYLDVQNLIFDRFFAHRVSTAELEAMGMSFYVKSGFVREFSDDLIEAIAANAPTAPGFPWFSFVERFHGAACRVAVDATAFGHRRAGYNLESVVLWQDPAHGAAATAWLRQYWNAVLPFLSEDVYVNHLASDDEERVRAAYGANYERLVALKDKFDPTNFFRMNQNVRPTTPN